MRRRYRDPRIGLAKAGPYDADRYRDAEVHIGLVTSSDIEDYSVKFLQKLEKGNNYYKGFRSIYKTGKLVVDNDYIKTIDVKSSSSFLQDIEDAYFEIAEKLPENSVIIMTLNDKIAENNYYYIKSLRFKYQKKTVRSQLISKTTLERSLCDITTLDFTLFNISNAIYAKLGGTPWLLERQLIPAGVFIGIAFTRPKIISHDGKIKEIFYYGVFTIHNKYGIYIDTKAQGIRLEIDNRSKIMGTKGLYVPRSHMAKLLEQVIKIHRPPIIIIHKSARFHKDEINATRQVLGSNSVSYALVHIESSNPYRGFDETTDDFTIVRGDLIVDREYQRAILFTTGRRQSDYGIKKRARPGTPRPLEIELEENKTPYDVMEFSKHVLGLTKLDWNTTDIEVRMPVTIKYARKVAAFKRYIDFTIVDVRDLI